MRRSSNAIFKNIMILGAAMSLSACNGMFEGIYDDPIEAEMEIKESSFHKSMLPSTLTGSISTYPNVKQRLLKSERNIRARYRQNGTLPSTATTSKPMKVQPFRQLIQVLMT